MRMKKTKIFTLFLFMFVMSVSGLFSQEIMYDAQIVSRATPGNYYAAGGQPFVWVKWEIKTDIDNYMYTRQASIFHHEVGDVWRIGPKGKMQIFLDPAHMTPEQYNEVTIVFFVNKDRKTIFKELVWYE